MADSPELPAGRLAPDELTAVAALGIAAIMAQLALMRELLGAFSGNELVLGIALGSWLLLTGVGARLGRRLEQGPAPERIFAAGLIIAAFLPVLQVAAVRVLRDVVFMRGAMVGVPATALGCLAALAPFCLVSGALLTLACRLERGGPAQVGLVYTADTVGSLAGGVLFSFALVPWFDHCALLGFPAVALALAAARISWRRRDRYLVAAALLVALALPSAALRFSLDDLTTAQQHAGQQVVFRGNSPYGRLVVTADTGQVTFFANGAPVLTSGHIEAIEETVHYAMCQRPGARDVLLIGGGIGGSAREILRYGVRKVTYVELDPQMIAAGRRFLPGSLDDPRIETVTTDGRRLVETSAHRFDVVLVDLAGPATFQLNRFYTAEFFASAARILREEGVLSVAIGQYANYVSPELGGLLASAHRTLRTSFREVRMIPGHRVFFLASNGSLTLDIATRLEAAGLTTRFVNRHYLDATLAPDRMADLERAVALPAELNTDFNPVLHARYLGHWLSQFRGLGWWAGGLLVAAATGYALLLGAVPRSVFAAGFAASALELVLLIGFQSLYGSVYRQVGLVVTVFMGGLAAGAWYAQRRLERAGNRSDAGARASRQVAWLGAAIALVGATLPFIIGRLGRLDATLGSDLGGHGVVLAATFLLAAITGAQFSLAGPATGGSAAGAAARLFSADLIGAATGAFLASAVLIPSWGLPGTCLATAGLNLVAAALTFAVRRRP